MTIVADCDSKLNILNSLLVDIGSILVNPSGHHIRVAEESFNIQCSVNINQDLPSSVSYPTIQWFYGPTNSSLPSGVTSTAVTNNPGSHTYSSTLQFSALQTFHGGMYTCRVGGNEVLAATSNVIVVSSKSCNNNIISFFTCTQVELAHEYSKKHNDRVHKE